MHFDPGGAPIKFVPSVRIERRGTDLRDLHVDGLYEKLFGCIHFGYNSTHVTVTAWNSHFHLFARLECTLVYPSSDVENKKKINPYPTAFPYGNAVG